MEIFGIIYLFFVFIEICAAQNLVAVEAKAKLPNPSRSHVAIYDGGESILILGGISDSDLIIDGIYSYNLYQDTILQIATFPNAVVGGLATFDNQGNAYYMGGYTGSYSRDIFKLDLNEENNLSLVGQLSEYHAWGTAINSNTDENKTLLFDYISGGATCLDLNTLITCGGKSLLGKYYSVAAFEHDGYAYVFGDSKNNSIEKINLENMESVLLEGFGFYVDYPAVVSDGTLGYIIGGYYPSAAGIPDDGIIQYDPQTNQHTFLQIKNFPVNGTNRRFNGAAVYVEKLDRIYIIGGFSWGAGYDVLYDKIWYIDLQSNTNTEEPSSTQIPTRFNAT